MFEDELSFSDTIEIVPTTNEVKNNTKDEEMGPIIISQPVEPERKEIKREERAERREEKRDDRRDDRKQENRRSQEIVKPSVRQQSIYDITTKSYIEKYTEYCNIPDFIVNQIFDIDDGKGTITIEEAIIMLINLFPNTREKINSAKIIEDAIKIGKSEIITVLYKECKYGFINIPLHSRENLSKKITSDFENNNFEASLYDYELMRLSGYIK